MNFKEPRDPNTKSIMADFRRLDPAENWPCHVGGGECLESAVEAHDDGAGGEFFVCAKHSPEVQALGKLLAEMTPEQLSKFETAVKGAE